MGADAATMDPNAPAAAAAAPAARGFLGSFFGALWGGVSGIFGGLLSGALWIGLPLLGVFVLLPDVTRAMGPDMVRRARNLLHEGWVPTILTFLGVGAGVGGAWSGIKGLLGGAFSGDTGPDGKSSGISMGGMIGGALAIAAVSAVAIGAIHHIHLDDADASLPDKAPPKAPPVPAKGRTGSI